MYTFDYPLFLLLNFDGGPVMDTLMKVISTPASWAWLYILILWLVWRKSGWRGALLFLVLVAAAVGLSDLIAGIFKHSGLLKNLWPSFPARLRPMYTPELEGQVHVVKQGGMYGTVSAHAATMVSMAVLAIGTIGPQSPQRDHNSHCSQRDNQYRRQEYIHNVVFIRQK